MSGEVFDSIWRECPESKNYLLMNPSLAALPVNGVERAAYQSGSVADEDVSPFQHASDDVGAGAGDC